MYYKIRKEGDEMDKLECGNCKYYIQHYIKVNGEYEATYCGSCKRSGKLKTLLQCSKVCGLFKPVASSISDQQGVIIKPKDRN